MSGAQTDLTLEDTRDGAVLRFAGRLVVAGLAPLERAAAAVKARPGPIAIDLSRVEALDTAGAWLLITLRDRLTAEGAQVTIEGTGPAEASLIETVEKALAKIEPAPPAPSGFLNWVAGVGEGVAGAWASFLDLLAFLGVTLARTAGLLVRPWRMRAAPLVHHMQEVGFNAFPIVVSNNASTNDTTFGDKIPSLHYIFLQTICK